MPALLFRVRLWLRRRPARIAATVVVVGVVAGLGMGLAAGARRTASAPARYTAWAGGDPDLEIVQLQGAPLTDAVRTLPGVASSTGITFVTAFLRGPDGELVFEPNPFAGDDRMAGARVVAGRFTDPARPDEFTANRAMAELLAARYGAHVGDQFDVAGYDQSQMADMASFGDVEPGLATFRATFVGIIESPTDFQEDAAAFYFSRSFLDAHPRVGVVQSILHVDLTAGTDPSSVLQAIQGLPGGDGAYPTGGRIVSAESRRAVRFQGTALAIVTAIALAASVALLVQLVGRSLRTSDEDATALIALGRRPGELAGERVVEGIVTAVAAAPVAVLTAWWATALFPLGSLRIFEPDPGPRLDVAVSLLGVLTLVAVAATGAAVAGRLRQGVTLRSGPRRPRTTTPAVPAGMPLSVGSHFALAGPTGGRRTALALATAVVGVAGLVGAGVVASSLSTIVDSPSRWGVNYDQLFGNPYVETDTDIVTPLVSQPGVVALSAAHIGALTLDGVETPALAVDPVKGGLLPTVLDGRAPTGSDEIGLGRQAARRLHVGIGSDVTATGPSGSSRQLHVVGIVVTPDSAGDGAAISFDTYASLNPTATRNLLLARFGPGTSALSAEIAAANYSPPDALPAPTSVVALRKVLPAPAVLAIILSVLLLVGFSYMLVTSLRARQPDFAILRALGAVRRQLRQVVHWQSTITAGLVTAVGVPLGLVLGRWVVQQLTQTLGLVPGVDVPVLTLLAFVIAALAVANVVAVIPARRAARISGRSLGPDR